MSLNQNLNKFSKIKLGETGKEEIRPLEFLYRYARSAALYYMHISYLFYFSASSSIFLLFCFYLLAENLFLAHVYLAFCIWHRPRSRSCPSSSVVILGPGLARRQCKVGKNPLSQPKVVKQPQIKIHELMHISYITADCFGLACL